MNKRGTRQGVENLWISRSGERTKLYGTGHQWRARYVDTAGRERTKRFRLKAEANEWLKQITRSGEDIAPPVQGVWTLSHQFAEWIRRAHIAETTRATRRHTWRAHVEPRWGDTQVTDIDPPGVKAWVADLAEKGTGVPTIENALGVLRMVLEDAVSDKRLIRNPCDGVKAPKRGPSKKARKLCYLSHEQVEQLAAAMGDDGTVVRTLAYTGIRWGELAALSVAAVDLKRRRLDIDRTVAEADGKLVWKAPKDYERRSVPIPPFLADELKSLTEGKSPEDLVFTAPEGGVLRLSLWRPRVFNKRRDGLKDFPKITPHDCRHTAASLTVSAGGNVLALARMLGHEDPSITLKTYSDLFDSDLDALADVLGKARTAALKQPTTTDTDTESEHKNVPGTQKP
ncbi:tyrosine-type recombinase/integrase [Mycolicibacterium conceptionense]|uniref:tyrosine-type recombinase/integrase n=1 Tax=Mycolicibacterium conceptionense TaxID=451644 RepID=UPI000A3E37C0|nr:site-specific integrase [Mycolicibacterium conceptionense]